MEQSGLLALHLWVLARLKVALSDTNRAAHAAGLINSVATNTGRMSHHVYILAFQVATQGGSHGTTSHAKFLILDFRVFTPTAWQREPLCRQSRSPGYLAGPFSVHYFSFNPLIETIQSLQPALLLHLGIMGKYCMDGNTPR